MNILFIHKTWRQHSIANLVLRPFFCDCLFFQMVNIPLSDKCIEILIDKLDVDGDGEVDFG